jgi:hypothetical protein
MWKRLFVSLLILLLALALPLEARAQSYSFSLDRETVNVFWNQDGTLAIDYLFTFTNQPGAHVIDFVDVGLPNGTYNFDAITADVGGNPVRISTDYQGSGDGVAVDLGGFAIQPGGSGTVHVLIPQVSDVLHPDSGDDQYASAVFSPTWFGGQYVNGSTDLTVTFHLPPGVRPEEPRWHAAPSGFPSEPETALDDSGRVTYTWHSASASGSTQYQFGASFPKSYVPASAIVTAPAFDFSGLVSAIVNSLGTLLCLGFFGFMFVGLPILTAVGAQRRKLQYVPPRIGIEGHGIKRGLTAVEAAILMEQPLDKVMTMILFGVIKKGAASVASREPLKVEVASPVPDDLHDYELNFLKAFKEPDARARQTDLQDTMVKLVRSVSDKMKGFSRNETRDYYKNIMEQAWSQVEAAATPEVKGQLYDQNLEWTMLDRDYDNRTRRVFTGPVFVPTWWGRYDPTYGPVSSGPKPASVAPAPGQGPSLSAPRLPGSDFAASVVTGVQTFSQKVIGDVNTFTSRVTNTTNPPPPPSRSTYHGGGGGGCACACACAGCACACAGGGR